MSSKLIYERFFWFHNKVKENKYPNTKTLSEKFDISRKTAQRDIDFLRDRMGVPLIYMPEQRGFAYEDHAYELPGFWLEEEGLTSLLLAYRLASAVPDAALKTALRSFLEQLLTRLAHPAPVSVRDLSNKVSVRNIEYSRTTGKIYHAMLDALLTAKPIRIEYFSPHSAEASTRDILPLHLLHYMGTWHIIAHCSLKNELRDFVLSRIRSIRPSAKKIKTGIPAEKVRQYVRQTFGIFRGGETKDVRLRFSKEIAPWIAEQNWHPRQQTKMEKDGRLILTVPVADFREIKREILRYGSQVEVVSPRALREDVKNEIEKMKNIYS
ncbi:MAG: transcriptional regulator [Deltaproteobacteria bacterium]